MEAKLTYLKLNSQTACPPCAAVPVNRRYCGSSIVKWTQRVRTMQLLTNRRLLLSSVFLALTLPAMAATPSAPARPMVNSGEAGFVAGTPVATEDGKKLIEKLKVGDRIWATNPQSRKSANHKVANLSAQDTNGLVDVLTASREKLETTPASLFWVNTKGWIAAKALFPGDQLLQRDGTFTQVFNVIPKYTAKAKVYSFDVEGFHTYYVGTKGILVNGGPK